MSSPATAAAPVVELHDLGRTFEGAQPVEALRRADLSVMAGDYVSIVGPSGSGKSTLLHLLGLLDRPTKGSYLLDGIDTADLSDAQRTALRGQRIGFVFQSFHLLSHRTVVENVMLAMLYGDTPKRQRHNLAISALERVGLGHRLDFVPTLLSGGERQRVAIARAIVAGPSLLLADEPTGNLDQTTSESIMEVFEELQSEGLTVMVITHDSVVAGRARRTVEMLDGVLSEVGQ
ncbi:MAG: ABC transporter ATP-binding protein [Actinomycetia bacterium]|nr:ABC transporter ATP-binding protein [Actinomycetes bacterium]MCP4962798.1 ABC transporter ATP-binding protein [Actinomycetes bacterium]